MAKTNIDYLRALPPFEALSEERINSLAKELSVVGYPKGRIVFNAGDEGDAFYIIKSGIVRVFIVAPDTTEKIILANLSEGDYFGEMALLTGGPRSASIETVTNASLIRMDRKSFGELLKEDPKVSISISNMLSQRLMQANLQRAASEQFYQSKIAPSGVLEDHSVIEIMKFCEENSLSGRVIIIQDEQQAIITYLKGTVQKVTMDELNDAEAMDALTQWQSGRFKIEPSMFSFDEDSRTQTKRQGKDQKGTVEAQKEPVAPEKEQIEPEKKQVEPEKKQVEPEKAPVDIQKDSGINYTELLETFLVTSFKKLIDLVGSQELKEIIVRSQDKCLPFFPVLEKCRFEIVPEINICLKNESDWTEKETLAIAVFLETIFKQCQDLVFGMSFFDPEKLAGESALQLKAISFFDYMDHAREFTF